MIDKTDMDFLEENENTEKLPEYLKPLMWLTVAFFSILFSPWTIYQEFIRVIKYIDERYF